MLTDIAIYIRGMPDCVREFFFFLFLFFAYNDMATNMCYSFLFNESPFLWNWKYLPVLGVYIYIYMDIDINVNNANGQRDISE